MAEKPQLGHYFKAGYPCLYVETLEYETAEKYVIDQLRSLDGVTDQFRLAVWKITTGLLQGTIGKGVKRKEFDPEESLMSDFSFVGNQTNENPILAIFHNPRAWLGETPTFQALLDAASACRLSGSHIVLLGPRGPLPIELKNTVTRIEFPLPNREELFNLFEGISLAYSDKISMADGSPWKDHLTVSRDKYGDVDEETLSETQKEVLVGAAKAALGLDSATAENSIALSIASTGTIDSSLIQLQKEEEIRKSDVLEFVSPQDSLDQVGGMGLFKTWLEKRKPAFSDEAREYGLPFPKGILLIGIGGTGKSLAAKAIANFLDLLLIRLDIGKCMRPHVGESEEAIRHALSVAEAVSPCICWIDELNQGLAGAKSSGELDSGVTARVVSTILTWRAETKAPVVLVGTANDVRGLPSMIYRKGRFDEVWAVDMPHATERVEIFKIHLKKRGRSPKNFNVGVLAQQTDQWVGAEIEACIEEAMFTAFADGGREFTTEDILLAISETIPQSERDKEEIKNLREWCEKRARPVSDKDEPAPDIRGTVRKLKVKGVTKNGEE